MYCLRACFLLSVQVMAMNAAVEAEASADTDEVDAEARRFLSETGANGTADPWNVGRAGQKVWPCVSFSF